MNHKAIAWLATYAPPHVQRYVGNLHAQHEDLLKAWPKDDKGHPIDAALLIDSVPLCQSCITQAGLWCQGCGGQMA